MIVVGEMTGVQTGLGAIIMEATGVAPEGRLTPGCLGLWSDDNERALERVAMPGHLFLVRLFGGKPDGNTK